MAYFPFFVDLSGRDGLIVGGGAVALRKARTLLPYGPRLRVAAPEICPELQGLEGVKLLRRPFEEADLEGCAFVVAATGDQTLNHHVASLCGERRIPVNVVDDREASAFLFPALLRRGELSVGVSTGGASPAAAACIRDRLAQALPERIEEILAFLARARHRMPRGAARRRLLSALAAECVEAGRPLTEEEFRRRLSGAEGEPK